MPVEIIAEIGINHNNSEADAVRLIDAAIDAGANTVKFQASVPENEVSAFHAPEHLALIRQVIPSFEFLATMKHYCDVAGVEFLCTPAEEVSLDFLVKLGVKRIKVGSDNLTNSPFLREVAKTELPVLLSTGMGNDADFDNALVALEDRLDIVIMQCVTSYPSPVQDSNLAVFNSWHPPYGMSDHTTTLHLPSVAVALGATVIEKHITLDPDADGPDHAASLSPRQFGEMVKMVRQTELAIGDGIKRPMPSEIANMAIVRKSVVAKFAIADGDEFTPNNLAVMRPGTGRPPRDVDVLIGRKSTRRYAAGEMID